MDSAHLFSGVGEHSVTVNRISARHWHALDDDEVAGRGEAHQRPDGRLFLSIDAWSEPVFDRLAHAMLADLPRPLHTVVDEADLDLLVQWERAGFAPRRREFEYVIPTDPQVTGLDSAQPPSGMHILGLGAAAEGPLRVLDGVIRDEVDATIGWQEMPAEVLSGPDGRLPVDPAKYAVAVRDDEYVGLVRVAPLPRQPHIGLVAVRSGVRRRGVARALLAEVLASAYRRGLGTASANVNQSNGPAIALFEGLGARRAGSTLELVLR
ncbi:MAG: GNAT family N-acetyltransferase [Hamadaea sp.]|uniref:GNAT family N-acetyltransferase n=1 Tax=Hamadaea sp. TaxID=2024425 RepID=UPI0017CD3084|nr:GNAT family N-acetyltransferase [Hamadaea sp.]NUR71041.1 GNAT family N-acetyltransferase [Hamadaea sp.]NUT23722.1 GNAT family N-acetyltransferase [Hamadaea sp.]